MARYYGRTTIPTHKTLIMGNDFIKDSYTFQKSDGTEVVITEENIARIKITPLDQEPGEPFGNAYFNLPTGPGKGQ